MVRAVQFLKTNIILQGNAARCGENLNDRFLANCLLHWPTSVKYIENWSTISGEDMDKSLVPSFSDLYVVHESGRLRPAVVDVVQ